MPNEAKSQNTIFLKPDSPNGPTLWASIRLSTQILSRLIELSQVLVSHRLFSATAPIGANWHLIDGWKVHHAPTITVYISGFSIQALICKAVADDNSPCYETATASFEWGSALEFTNDYWPKEELLGITFFERSGGWESAEEESQFRREVLQTHAAQ